MLCIFQEKKGGCLLCPTKALCNWLPATSFTSSPTLSIAPCTLATWASLFLRPAPGPLQVLLLSPGLFFPQFDAQLFPSLPSVSAQMAALPEGLLWPAANIGRGHPLIPSPALFYHHLAYRFTFIICLPHKNVSYITPWTSLSFTTVSPGPRTVPRHTEYLLSD